MGSRTAPVSALAVVFSLSRLFFNPWSWTEKMLRYSPEVVGMLCRLSDARAIGSGVENLPYCPRTGNKLRRPDLLIPSLFVCG